MVCNTIFATGDHKENSMEKVYIRDNVTCITIFTTCVSYTPHGHMEIMTAYDYQSRWKGNADDQMWNLEADAFQSFIQVSC